MKSISRPGVGGYQGDNDQVEGLMVVLKSWKM